MKLKVSLTWCVLLSVITLIIASCSKGPTGATGPAGAQGPAGSAGANGTTGATGPAGTANVIYSDWIDTVTYHPSTDSSVWVAKISAPQLVDSIINQGDVKVYLNVGSDSTGNQLVMSLPIYDLFLTGDVINPYFQSGLITLAATVDESSFTSNGFHYFQYRYILIPGGIKAGGRVANGTSINWNDYNQVKKYLGLKN